MTSLIDLQRNKDVAEYYIICDTEPKPQSFFNAFLKERSVKAVLLS